MQLYCIHSCEHKYAVGSKSHAATQSGKASTLPAFVTEFFLVAGVSSVPCWVFLLQDASNTLFQLCRSSEDRCSCSSGGQMFPGVRGAHTSGQRSPVVFLYGGRWWIYLRTHTQKVCGWVNFKYLLCPGSLYIEPPSQISDQLIISPTQKWWLGLSQEGPGNLTFRKPSKGEQVNRFAGLKTQVQSLEPTQEAGYGTDI